MSFIVSSDPIYSNYFIESDDKAAEGILNFISKNHSIVGMAALTKQFKAFVKDNHNAREQVAYLERFRKAIIQLQKSPSKAFEKYAKRFATGDHLLQACGSGYLDLIKIFHAKNNEIPLNKVSSQATHKNSLLHCAANKGHTEVALWLIGNGAPLNHKEGELQRTPLHRACLLGRVRIVGALIAASAAINPQDKDGLTPLHLACSANSADNTQKDPVLRARLALRLFAAGADPSIQDKNGRKPSAYFVKKDLNKGFQQYIQDVKEIPYLTKVMWIKIFELLLKDHLTNNVMQVCRAFHDIAANTLVKKFLEA